jgi:hypothetical protein
MTEKKTAAKESRPKETDEPVASRVQDRAPDSAPIAQSLPPSGADDDKKAKSEKDVAKVAEQILGGSQKWGSGRELDERLKKEGYDVDVVRREVQRQRGAARTQG